MRRSVLRLGRPAVLAALALAAGVLGPAGPARAVGASAPAAPARASAASAPGSALVAAPGGDSGQPAPGYTVSNPPLTPATVGGVPAKVWQGVYRGAAYDLEVPPTWNGELVLWAHGYRGTGTVLTVDTPSYGLRQKFLDEGYAWASSSYTDNGYDAGAGVTSTHDLAVHVTDLVGKRPRRTYIAGVSLGGHVIGRSLEQYPRFYSGALPMCGVLGDNRLFDYFLDYNAVAQALSGVQAYPLPANYLTSVVPGMEASLGLTGLTPNGPDTLTWTGEQFRAIVENRTGGERPGFANAFAFWKEFPFLLAATNVSSSTSLALNPGQVATNASTVYSPNWPVDVNAVVGRVPAANPDARSSKALSAIPRILGRPDVPVLTLHGLGDMFVPFSMEEIYGAEAARNGQGSLVVQRAIRSANHCEFSPAEAGSAWDDLARWVRAGGAHAPRWARPAGDPVTDPKAVAKPTFGCRFSDPTGSTGVSTRGYYAPCPTT